MPWLDGALWRDDTRIRACRVEPLAAVRVAGAVTSSGIPDALRDAGGAPRVVLAIRLPRHPRETRTFLCLARGVFVIDDYSGELVKLNGVSRK